MDIPNGVTSIHDYAFNNCSGLTSVDIPNSVSWIGKYAFQNCTLLASVTIPNSVINIGDYAFSNCNNIESVSVLCDPKSVGSSIFEGCSNIKRVLFDCESVTDYFSQTKITEITMTDKVTSIGDNAFYGCSGLTSINIPYSVTSIGEYVFYGCDNLKSVKVSVTDLSTFCNNDIIPLIRNKINREVTLIDSKGFEIKILVIPDDVTSIGSQAFAGCRGLTSVIMGAGVKEIGPSAFYGIHPMKTIWMTNTPPSGYGNLNGEINFVPNDQFIALNNTVVYPFLSNMFEVDGVRYVPINPSEHTCDAVDCIYNESTKNVKISSHVNYKKIMFTVNQIQPYLAQNNHYIETLTLDYSDIPESAFSGCNGLTSVVVGKEVTSISEDAFRDCSSLTSVNISDLAAWCKIDFANNFSNPIYYAHHLFLNGNEIEKLVIPSSLTTIKNRTFYGCHGLTSVTIPSNVISIGDQAFAGCGGLTSFIIPNNVTSIGFNSFGGCNSLASVIIGDGVATIGDQAFYNCSGLTSVAIGDGVKSIGNYAFNNCSGLTSVSIGNNVTFIDAGAFNGCENLNSVQISDLVAWCKIRFRVKDNLSANPLYYAHHLFLNGEEIKDLEIPNGVTFIGENAFQCCIGLTSVTIPSSVTKISGHAFQGCRGLTSITIANGVTSIEENAFSSCIGLTSLTIPQSVETIGCDVFSGCNGLKQVIIQNRKTTLNFEYDDTFIGVSYPLFKSCPLEEIYIGGNIKINFRSQSEYGLEPLFSRKSTLQKVKIGGEATDIQKREFYGCKNLQDVIIGNKVATIGEEAFSGCSGLKTVELGTHVKDIGKTAFSGCTSMESITSKATAPPTCGSEALNDIDKWACNLFVPQGYLSAYQSADQWKTFYLMDDNIPPILSGDANCDNEVTIDDIKFIEDYIMGNIPDDFDEDAADFNGDGYINVADIVAIINYLKENK